MLNGIKLESRVEKGNCYENFNRNLFGRASWSAKKKQWNDQWHDSHRIPGSMNIDFPAIVNALKEIGYSGGTREAECYLRKFTAEIALEGVKDQAESARKLVRMLE